MLSVYIGVMFTHFIADFVCQSHWMAINKSKNLLALIAHVSLYATVMLFGMVLICSVTPEVLDSQYIALWAMTNWLFHFITDYYTSKINRRLWNPDNLHWFFVGVGFDQFIHTATLLITTYMMGL